MVFLIGLAASLSTYLGGLFALKFKDSLHLILSFSAGAVLGVAFLDLLPQALVLTAGTYKTSHITAIVALGFLIFMVLSNWILIHPHSEDCEEPAHQGRFAAGSLALHSFLDGIAIGLAFQVSSRVGIIVAIAVLAHDFSDGINTVGLILKGKGKTSEARNWLIVDAIAPLLGVVVASTLSLPAPTLGIILAILCGFFIFIGASDLLPESHHNHAKVPAVLATVAGMLVMYFAIALAGV
jgi:zinc transporter ZupT